METYNKEDLIIRFPKEFFDNERLNFNMSTKGANSMMEKEWKTTEDSNDIYTLLLISYKMIFAFICSLCTRL